MQKAVLDYPNSDNLGDFIQSIAAAAFLDENPVFLDRDQLHLGTSTPTQLVLNGWFMEQPHHWPPGPGIIPLFHRSKANAESRRDRLSAKACSYRLPRPLYLAAAAKTSDPGLFFGLPNA